MGGWGEEHTTPSGEHVRRVQERMAADTLAEVIAAFLKAGTSKNYERFQPALDNYRKART